MKSELAIDLIAPKIQNLKEERDRARGRQDTAKRILEETAAEIEIYDDLLSDYAEVVRVLNENDENREVQKHHYRAEDHGHWGNGFCMAMVMRGGGGDQCGLPELHRLHVGGDE